jgi:hypothetical protein
MAVIALIASLLGPVRRAGRNDRVISVGPQLAGEAG